MKLDTLPLLILWCLYAILLMLYYIFNIQLLHEFTYKFVLVVFILISAYEKWLWYMRGKRAGEDLVFKRLMLRLGHKNGQ